MNSRLVSAANGLLTGAEATWAPSTWRMTSSLLWVLATIFQVPAEKNRCRGAGASGEAVVPRSSKPRVLLPEVVWLKPTPDDIPVIVVEIDIELRLTSRVPAAGEQPDGPRGSLRE